ncbi:ribosome-associated heat shock protein Hsp15 [Ferrimonas sediminicola]|uniref:Heat shock protein 15 n=1 Tax=Ferrimonas sediminicola TaxID=2569538 RepID=A0A4U1BAR4_9GAMM|nr:ribosome-associated heat shock protein Hsp15 [Ferrimonas sediminicola]TKB47638.1 ribosome-associated heat shock protein Hsp15 [Ferrimonas sediminicola]
MTKKQPHTELTSVRIDKWLWAARFYKTRPLAQEMVSGGKVHHNGQRCKPSRLICVGSTLTLWQGNDEREVVVLGLSEKRLSAPLAQQLYRETEESLKKREAASTSRRLESAGQPLVSSRPDKKQRRQIMKLKQQ